MLQSITTCWPLLSLNEKKPKQSSYQFEKREQSVIAMHAGKGLYTLCVGKHGGRYKTNFISQKPVLAFQTLTLAMLGK